MTYKRVHRRDIPDALFCVEKGSRYAKRSGVERRPGRILKKRSEYYIINLVVKMETRITVETDFRGHRPPGRGNIMPKRISFIGLIVLLSFCLSACKKESDPSDASNAGSAGETAGATAADGGNVIAGSETGASYEDFIALMSSIKERGDKSTQLGLQTTGEYYYSFAGASTSALRYAVEYILWLKGEGDTLANFTSDSRYSGWDTIAEINYASPYPSYFEGLLLEIQGQYEESITPYAAASIMPLFPDEGLDFYYLKKAEVADLYQLRNRLRELEDQIYAAYMPELTGRAWNRQWFSAEYLVGLSSDSVKNEDYPAALTYAKLALKADPFSADVWNNAAACALLAQDLPLTGSYVDEGLAIFPEEERLLELRRSFLRAGEGMEVEP